MNQIEIAWVAGVIEGEGTISVPKSGAYPRVAVAMCDFDVVRRLHEVTGVGSLTHKKAGRDGWKPQLCWTVHSRKDVARLLCAVAPLLGERRRARALQAAEALARPPRPKGRPQPISHGTVNGSITHRRRGEKPCESCRLAENTYARERLARKRAAA